MISSNIKFKLVANCIPVKGANQSVICDLQRNSISLIPNDLYHILTKYEGKTIEDIKSIYNNKYDDVIVEYFEFLLSEEFIFFTDSPELFPKLSMQWHTPQEITNAIIDVDENSIFDLHKVIHELNEYNCKFVEFRYYNSPKIETLKELISFIEDLESSIISIDLNFPYREHFIKPHILKLLNEFPRISSIRIYSAPNNEFIKLDHLSNKYLIYLTEHISNEKCCGKIDSSLFAININNFTESKQYNSCLNRKISIDVNGNIKNCPSMTQSFGNIDSTNLKEALNHKDFKKYWNITKDQIDVCKDCEFRYVCTDCRAYREDPNNDYSKPLKCGYNPYTNKWEEWSTNTIKEKAIEYYKMQELV